MPEVRDNVRLEIGWLADTLPAFLDRHSGPIAFLHIDTDTYGACKDILALCKPRLAKGAVVLFDEAFAFPNWQNGEFKALTETLPDSAYTWRAFEGERAAISIRPQ